MSTTQNNPVTGEPVEQAHPSIDTILGLADVMRFVSQNRDLPKVSWASVSLGHYWEGCTRADLERFAIAADAAGLTVEEDADSTRVRLTVKFSGDVRVSIEAKPVTVGAIYPPPPAPAYPPILPVCPHCGGHGAVQIGDGETDRDPCATCDGRGYLVPDPPVEVEDFVPSLTAEQDADLNPGF